MNEEEADDGKEDGGHQPDQKGFGSDPTHGHEFRIQSNPGHGNQYKKLAQSIDMLNQPLPLRGRNWAYSVPDGPDDGHRHEPE